MICSCFVQDDLWFECSGEKLVLSLDSQSRHVLGLRCAVLRGMECLTPLQPLHPNLPGGRSSVIP